MAGYMLELMPHSDASEDSEVCRESRMAFGKPPYGVLRNRFQRGPLKGIYRFITKGCLRRLAPSDKLYVSAHGERDCVFEYRSDGSEKRYSAAEFATYLEKEGLPKSFRDLRIFACNSGGSGPTPCFAQDLATQLRARGYGNIRVAGYMGNVAFVDRFTGSDGAVSEHKSVRDDDDEPIGRASAYRHFF